MVDEPDMEFLSTFNMRIVGFLCTVIDTVKNRSKMRCSEGGANLGGSGIFPSLSSEYFGRFSLKQVYVMFR